MHSMKATRGAETFKGLQMVYAISLVDIHLPYLKDMKDTRVTAGGETSRSLMVPVNNVQHVFLVYTSVSWTHGSL